MKLHELTVSAFGPFAGTERVDFDALNDAGLFLLSGATGAGKTSILDAVCFALYGQVPGVRGIKALKSQHAGDQDHPEVVLDFSVRDRRFVVRRSPEWTRPKRRGEGLATEKAGATLREIRTDGEHLLSSRAAEVGQLVSDLVGMQAAQFQQVAMLPQGEFQRFLQASTQERHDVLQRLFHTDRFMRIEEWVADHSKRRRDDSAAGQAAVQRLVDGIAERAGTDLPQRLSPDGLVAAAAGGEALPWAGAQVDAAARAELAARRVHDAAGAAAQASRRILEEATRRSELVGRRLEAEARLTALEQDAETAAAADSALAAHRRAQACLPVLQLLDRSGADVERAAQAARRSAETAARRGVHAMPDPDEPWTATVDGLRERARRAHDLLPLLTDVADTRQVAAEQQAQLASLEAALAASAVAHDALPARRAAARAALDGARADAARVEACTLQLTSARQRARAAAALPGAEMTLGRLDDEARDARDRAADARDHLQGLVQRRLDGIASELAERLVDGEACLVCGATDHPVPAAAADDAVTADEQAAATAAYEQAQADHAAAVTRRTAAAGQLASLRELAAGRDHAEWQTELGSLQATLAAAQAAAVGVCELETTLVRLEEQLAVADRDLRDHQLRVAELTESVRASTDRAARAEQAVARAWADGDIDPASLQHLVAQVDDDLASAVQAQEAARQHAESVARLDDVAEQARRAAADHGFADLDSVRDAALADGRVTMLELQLSERARLTASARAVLDDPAVAALDGAAHLDLSTLAATAEVAGHDADSAARAFHLAEQRHCALVSLVARLEEALVGWAPARDEFVLAESMSRLVRGMGGDNQLQMRLSSYVLATRLDQVLDAANERLSHLRDQRYLLQRTGRAARRGSQAGLGLEVVDQWTGDVRDPATLSGGETFVVSLSLALGLADVVTHEAGGTEIETLFVDEGFGTLDADTLDDVMDRLDGLRAGGRTVGVVSHVTELRSRIPVQVHVDKTPSGSSIRTHSLVG